MIFVIKVPKMSIPEKYDNYDHGFVHLNQYNLAGDFEREQEVLFNALNIFKVIGKFHDREGYLNYELEYGSIFSLVRKKNLNPKER